MFFAAVAAVSSPIAPALVFRQYVEVDERTVRLGDIIDVSLLPLPIAERAAGLPVAAIPLGRTRLNTSSRAVAARVRARLPAAAAWFVDIEERSISISLAPDGVSRPASSETCVRIVETLAAGAIPRTSDVERAACSEQSNVAAFTWDHHQGLPRALRTLQEGEVVRGVPDFALARVRPGQRLVVRANVGPVALERQVEALQGARPGQKLFVRAADGTVFPVGLRERGE